MGKYGNICRSGGIQTGFGRRVSCVPPPMEAQMFGIDPLYYLFSLPALLLSMLF